MSPLPSQSTVIFVQSTAHWEAIQQQRAQLIGVSPPSTPLASQQQQQQDRIVQKKPRQQETASPRNKPSRLIGKEGSRRRNRWTNNTFSDHPSAVLYAEDLRPPGYEAKAPKYDVGLISRDDSEEEEEEEEEDQVQVHALPHNLPRHVRHDLKKAHISKGLVTAYESQLIQFIDLWLNDTQCLDNACLELRVVSNNQFERYVVHTMSRYYGFASFSKTNDQNQRVTYICHPAYLSYITKHSGDDEIDYASIQEWDMPDKSFFEYLFHTV
ncbi:hypothetical protein V8B55DRAFT_1535704 [Mucor lusitanicus]|uniref:R3H domain-containing protein n=2 Tax=Mucor circinelloides f. lusitanicus TaxID=29924 RepID=A0A162YNP3_MUCCL|nr:hypothetical protein FB192DRAFT_1472883 [Mucor lusitanicus]OAC99726.1 hypothetical protein MUCCIDRAFT_113162 [Mucor lusitanicus CBS 277.49]